MSSKSFVRPPETTIFVPPHGSNARREIKRLREEYHLSWSDLVDLTELSKGTLIHYWQHPAEANQNFWYHFQLAVSKMNLRRGHVHEILYCDGSSSRLPRQIRLCVKPRKCAGHGDWCLFGDPRQKFCGAECKALFEAKQESRGMK